MEPGRPRRFSDPQELQELLDKYTQKFRDVVDPADELDIPSIEMFCYESNIPKSTVYEYKHREGFSEVLEKFKDFCIAYIAKAGWSGKKNAAITKLILSNHGIIEKTAQEITGGQDNTLTIKITEAE